MTDLDCFAGVIEFLQRSENSLFAEYTMWSSDNNNTQTANIEYDFQIVALFELKSSIAGMYHAKIGRQLYSWLCRVLRNHQDISPKLFYVIGVNGPWTLIEVNIETGTPDNNSRIELEHTQESWNRVWSHLGLFHLRNQMHNRLREKHKSEGNTHQVYVPDLSVPL